MATAYGHKWGQIIGNLVESSIREILQEISNKYDLYLDFKRKRAARKGLKVAWQDRNGNSHDLDYVLERGGTDETRGDPAAFIETAWRRYTKHSRNKSQEIEGAILALAETYSHLKPFLGVILAGVFTKGALEQLRSRGFIVAYFPYESILHAFAAVGIDASFDEGTGEKEFLKKIKSFAALPPAAVKKIRMTLLNPARVGKEKSELVPPDKPPLEDFLAALDKSLSRRVQGVTVAVLHGSPKQMPTAAEAIAYIQGYTDSHGTGESVLKYEIYVRYNTGDGIQGTFNHKDDAIRFLKNFA
jgi:hypothetical protein